MKRDLGAELGWYLGTSSQLQGKGEICTIYPSCPHPVTVYIRGPIKGYIYPYSNYYLTVTGWGQYPRYTRILVT